jgi:hypothetical protein
MAMMELTLGDQTILYDPEATAAIYASMKNGWAEDCRCAGCRNLMAQRDEVYPHAFIDLLRKLGIDPDKESEAVADGPVGGDLYHYGGWFFFVGQMVLAGEYLTDFSDPSYFTCFFTRVGPRPKAFDGVPGIAVEFTAILKWVIPETWDSDLRAPTT